jgi:hypothetical protein
MKLGTIASVGVRFTEEEVILLRKNLVTERIIMAID